jgi:hypothetical protein
MIIIRLKGGFGNNLFQYAAARALADRIDDEVKLDIEFFKNESLKDIYRLNYLNIKENIATPEEIIKLSNTKTNGIIERIIKKTKFPSAYKKRTHFIEKNHGFSFDKRIFKIKSNVYLDGWFSNENYFKDIREILIKEFEMKNELRDESKKILKKILNTNAVSVHIRRGAFAVNDYFGVLPEDYYYRAVDYIKSKLYKPHFYIFSDDTDWVREHLKIEGDCTIIFLNSSKASFHHTQYDYEDLTLMKNCKHNIIAFSTFSWWGAWLNQTPDKIVIAPIKALNNIKAQKYYQRGNFIPNYWIKL